jgi:hypothetical protein
MRLKRHQETIPIFFLGTTQMLILVKQRVGRYNRLFHARAKTLPQTNQKSFEFPQVKYTQARTLDSRKGTVINMDRNRDLLRGIGSVFLILGLIIVLFYIPQATQYSTDSHLLDTLRYICLGIALELFGIGIITVARK